MGLVQDDRCKETSTTTGTGTYTLLGAVAGFQSFAAIGNTNTCYYLATDGINWEVGLGTYTAAGTTLARTSVFSSSNADAAVNWAAGTRYISVVAPAAIFPSDQFIIQDADYTLANVGTEQKAFNAVANGTLALGTGRYRFEALIYMTVMSAASGNAAFDILGAGTATIGKAMYNIEGNDTANATTPTGGQIGIAITAQSNASIVTATTQTQLQFFLNGHFTITVAGTIIPSLTLVTAVATALVKDGSYFKCTRVGASGVVSQGQWT